MNEVRIFGGLLAVLLIATYVSWTGEDDGTVVATDVTIWAASEGTLERVELVTRTQTIAFSYQDGDPYGSFEMDRAGRREVFVANDAAAELMKGFTPFVALRSLGRNISDETRKEIGLDKPPRRLTVVAGGQTKTYDVGKRTHGKGDHYVRPKTSDEVFLVKGATLGDLEKGPAKLMQREVLVKPLREVGGAILAANGKSQTLTHANRRDRRSAYWAPEGADEADVAAGNFMDKLARLSIRSYPTDLAEFEKAETFLEIRWTDDDGKMLGSTSLHRLGEGKTAKYFAKSDRTVRPGELSRASAERIEQDLSTVLP